MVVRVADTEKEKSAKRFQVAMANLGANSFGINSAALGLSQAGNALYQLKVGREAEYYDL